MSSVRLFNSSIASVAARQVASGFLASTSMKPMWPSSIRHLRVSQNTARDHAMKIRLIYLLISLKTPEQWYAVFLEFDHFSHLIAQKAQTRLRKHRHG